MKPGVARLTRCGWLLTTLVVSATAGARAQSSMPGSQSVTFVVTAQAKLTLSAATQTFPNADPDAVPQVPASEGPLTITAKGRTAPGSQMILSVIASNDLRSGMNVIPVSALTWTATGAGFGPGTMSSSIARRLAAWNSSGFFVGTQTYFFANSWTYATGSYGVTLTYTLSAP